MEQSFVVQRTRLAMADRAEDPETSSTQRLDRPPSYFAGSG